MALTSNLGHGHGPFRPAAFFQPSVATSDFGSLDESDYWDGDWFVATQRTVAIAVAATTLAASTASALANSHQDELAWPSYGNTGGMPQDLWRAASNTPRTTFLYSNEEIVAQATFPAEYDPAPIQFVIPKPVVFAPDYATDEVAPQPITFVLADPDSVFVSIRKAPCLPEQYATDEVVPQATTPVREDYGPLPDCVKPLVVLATINVTDEEVVAQPIQSYGDAGGLGIDLWVRASTTPRITQIFADDVIVSQPAANILDDDVGAGLYVVPAKVVVAEQYATDEIVPQPTTQLDDSTALVYVCPQRIVVLLENYATDEIVPQVITPLDEDKWEVGSVVQPVKQLSVFEAQDEIVPPPVAQPWIEEWTEPFAVKAKSILPTLWLADEIAPQTSTSGDPIGSLPDLWSRISTTPRAQYLFADEAIVPQPPPLSIEEGTWEPLFVVPATRSLYVGIQQEEIVPQPILPTSISIDEGTWEPPFVPMSVRSLYVGIQQEEIVPQPILPTSISIDDSDPPALFVVAEAGAWMPTPWQYGLGDGAVAAQPPTFPADDCTPPDLFHKPATWWLPVSWQFGLGEGSIWSPLREDYFDVVVVRRCIISSAEYVDEAIVPQPAPLSIEEGEWTPPFVIPSAKSLDVQQTQDEMVPQPLPLAIDEGVWTPPFTVPPVISRHVEQLQDEVVVRIVIDEDYFLLGWHVVPSPIVAPLHVSEEWTLLPTSIAIDEVYWNPVVGIVKNPWYVLTTSDEVTVPQPTPIHIDEQYWHTAAIVRIPKPHTTLLGEDDVIAKAKRKRPKLVETPQSRTLAENPTSRKIAENPQSRKIAEE